MKSIVCATALLLAATSCALDEGHEEEPLSFATAALEQAASASAASASADKALLNAPIGEWTYVSFPDTTCRDGSASGLAVRRSNTSNRVLIYMEGGGICADAQTCFDGNPSNTNDQREPFLNAQRGVFDFTNAANPVRDWTLVYVPYCSGDLHAGDKKNVVISGVGTQQFQGRNNLARFLKPIAKLVKKPSDVVLTGASAGGYGAMMSFVPVQNAFPDLKVRMIDDSAPFLNDSAHSVCLQKLWRTTFGWEKTFLNDCGKGCPDKSDFMQDYASWLAKKYDDRPWGLIEAIDDVVITNYLGVGQNDCTGALWSSPLPADTFKQALLSFRKNVKPYGYSTYYPATTEHTFMESDAFYASSAGGKSLRDWFTQILNGKNAGNVGP